MAVSISEIKDIFKNTAEADMQSFIDTYKEDSRAGVQKLVEQGRKELAALANERIRLEKMKEFEKKYEQYAYICGIDEAGRGPLAGPVVAGACILPKDAEILYLNDSKKLSEKKGDLLFDEIKKKAIAWGVGVVSPERIDEINILEATKEAMRIAISSMDISPDLLLIDAVHLEGVDMKQVSIIKGDARSVSIAAASVLAKVTRDRIMVEYAQAFPEYGFEGHKGYGSAAHIAKIKEIGPCAIHRRTFIKNFVS